MKDLLTSALSFNCPFDNHTIVAYIEYGIEGHYESEVLTLSAPSTQDVMMRVFMLNKAGMDIVHVKFLQG